MRLIGLQVCFHIAMKHENDLSNVVGSLQVLRIYSFMKEIKVYTRALYNVFLFAETENNNLIKEITYVLRAVIAGLVKTSAKFVRILQQLKAPGSSLICSQILTNVHLCFHQTRKARRTCFIS